MSPIRRCDFPQNIKKMANARGLVAEEDSNGRWRILSERNRAYAGVFNTEAEAKEYLKDIINTNAPDLSGQTPFPVSGTPITPIRIKPNSSLLASRLREPAQVGTLALPWLASLKSTAQAIENAGFGKAFSVVYETTQKAKGLANQAIALVERAALGGKTFQEAFKDIDKRALNFTSEERKLATLYSEAYTKPEIETLLGMKQLDIDASNIMQKLGQEHNIPKLLRLNALIDSFLFNQEEFVTKKLPELKNAILEKRLSEEFIPRIQELAAGVNPNVKTYTDVIKLLDLSGEEIQALINVREFATKLNIDPKTGKTIDGSRVYNLPAIFRHATADKLETGFKTGKEQFIAKRGMSKELVQLAEDRIKVLDDAFSQYGNGHSREVVMGVQLPTFRQFIDAGLMPGKSFKNATSGPVKAYAEVLDDFVEGSDILTRRVLSGHLNPHELDPAISLSKHVRNLIHRDTLDPVIDSALDEVANISDERAKKIMYNYLQELQGVPTEGMQKLTDTIRTVGRYLGVGFDDRISERLINNLNFLSSSSSIPFRAALVMRNFYQMTLSIPIVGPRAWWHGVKVATGWNGSGFEEALKEAAWDRAYKAQALKPDVLPLHGGESITDIGSRLLPQSVSDKLPKELSKLGYDVKQATNWAFSKYRSADDLGRVVQFEAGRLRAGEALAKFRRGEISLEDAMSLGKVRTFNELTQKEFERLVNMGADEEAKNLIGKELADKVHFLYGDVNHPTGWGGVAGKLLGQFGTFPVQYASHLGQGLTLGSARDIAEFAIGHTALNVGIIAAGSELFDADLESWAFAPSLQYTGGPYAELGLSLITAWGGSDAEKALAKSNIDRMMPWSLPSIFTPYSYFINDFHKAWSEEDSFGRILARGSGIRFLSPGQKTKVEQGFGWVSELVP